MARPDSKSETLQIPADVRAAIDARDAGFCRVCGQFQGERRAIHHVIYGGDARGMGGRRVHNVEEMVTVCWVPGTLDCHSRVHSNKGLYQPLLLEVVTKPGVTVLQLLRWARVKERRGQARP
jgi:hypothetical protein